MPENQDGPKNGIAAGASPTERKPRKTAKISRTASGTFKKGVSGNPGGVPSIDPTRRRHQIFGTRNPFKQALIREVLRRSDNAERDELERIATTLLDKALRPKDFGHIQAISLLATTLDGPAKAEPPPPSQTTLQIVMHNIRNLNLTAEQRDQYKQLIQQRIDDARAIDVGAGNGARRDGGDTHD